MPGLKKAVVIAKKKIRYASKRTANAIYETASYVGRKAETAAGISSEIFDFLAYDVKDVILSHIVAVGQDSSMPYFVRASSELGRRQGLKDGLKALKRAGYSVEDGIIFKENESRDEHGNRILTKTKAGEFFPGLMQASINGGNIEAKRSLEAVGYVTY